MVNHYPKNAVDNVFVIQRDGQTHNIYNSNSNYQIAFMDGEAYFNDYFVCTDDGFGHLVIEERNPITDEPTKIVLIDWLEQNPDTALEYINESDSVFNYINNNDPIHRTGFYDDGTEKELRGYFLNQMMLTQETTRNIYAGGGSDTILANKGNQTIYFDEYNKGSIIIYRDGDGKDIIHDATSLDVIDIYGIAENEVVYNQEGLDLVIQSTKNQNDSITLINWFASSNKLDRIVFRDGSIDIDGLYDVEDNETMSNISLELKPIMSEYSTDTLHSEDCVLISNQNINMESGNSHAGANGTNHDHEIRGENSYISTGNLLDSAKINIEFNFPDGSSNSYAKTSISYGITKDGNSLIIYHHDNNTAEEIIDSVTIENYFVNANLQDKVYVYSYDINSDSRYYDRVVDEYFNGIALKGDLNEDNILNGSEFNKPVTFYGGNKNDVMYGQLEIGSEFYTGKKGEKLIVSGSNTDIIHVEEFSNTSVAINDNSAFQSERFNDEDLDSFMEEWHELTLKDELHINNSKDGESAFIFFDVAADESYPPSKDGYLGGYSPNLYITKNSDIMRFLSNENTPGYISIENWFKGRETLESEELSDGNGVIENIYYNGGKLSQTEYIDRVTADVREKLSYINFANKKTNYQSAMDVLVRGTKAEKQAIIECYTKENVHITLSDKTEKTTYFVSTGNDFISVADNYIINGGKGDDKFLRADGAENYILNGEDGNDVLQGGANVVLNTGKGDNVILIDDGATSTTITQGNGKDYIHFSDDVLNSEDTKYTKDGNDLIIAGNSGSETTLKDYFKYGAKSSIKGFVDSTANISESIYNSEFASSIKDKIANATESVSTVLAKENVQIVHTQKAIENKSAKYTGTDFNDDIDASGIELFKVVNENGIKIEKEREGFDKGYILNGGKGNDTITGTSYADTITGGIGLNTIKYSKGDGNDVINLTKGENFILDLIDVEHIFDADFEIVKNDLRIYADKEKRNEYITIKNFAAKDVTNNGNAKKGIEDESSVFVRVNNDYNQLYDLRGRDFYDNYYLYKINAQKNYTGTWLNEEITTSITEPLGKNDKGITINAAGGDDKITGSLFNDVITGGVGENTINYIQGSGQDVINLTKGEILHLNIKENVDMLLSSENLIFAAAKNNKDLEITIEGDDESKITIKNYYGKETGAKVYINDADITTIENSKFGAGDEYFENNSKFTGSALSDVVDATNAPEGRNGTGVTINAGAGDDKITGSLYNDTITGGIGENTINYIQGSGQDVINLTKGEVLYLNIKEDADVLLDSESLKFAAAKNKRDLEITIDGDDESKITIKNYYGKETGATVTINGMDLAKIDYSKFGVDSNYFENNSVYNGSALSDVVNASELQDPTNIKTGAGVTVNTGAGDDRIWGSEFKDTIKCGNGDDIVEAGAEADTVYGENGIDYIYGDAGNDKIYGGNDTDFLYGGDGNDIIYGDNGNDFIDGGIGSDKLYGGNGNDTIHSGTDAFNMPPVYGNDFVKAGAGDDIIYLESNEVEAYGEAGNDEYHVTVNEADIIDSAGNDIYHLAMGKEIEITDYKDNDIYNVSHLNDICVEITDKNGSSDKIMLTDTEKNNVTLLFDVKADKNGKAVNTSNKDLYILYNNDDNSNITQILNAMKWSAEEPEIGITVENYFGSASSKIETITDMNGATLDSAAIESIRQNVAMWLARNDYDSALEVLAYGKDVDVLLAIYQGATWQDAPVTP